MLKTLKSIYLRFKFKIDELNQIKIDFSLNPIKDIIKRFKLPKSGNESKIKNLLSSLSIKIKEEIERDRIPVLTLNILAISINLLIVLFFFLFISIGFYSAESKEPETIELKIEIPKNQTIELKPINQSEKPSPPLPLPPKIEEEKKSEPIYPEPPSTQPINIPPPFETPYENRDISDVPEYLKFFTQNKCYWDLRDKYNFGSYFNPCEICAQPNIYGMWKKACDCCDISYGAKTEWKGA